MRAEAERKLQEIPVMAKGVKQSSGFDKRWLTVGAAGAARGALLLTLTGRARR